MSSLTEDGYIPVWIMLLRTSSLAVLVACITWQQLAATKISGVEDQLTGSWNLTLTDALRRTLLPGYDRWVRPASANEVTPVKFSLKARHLQIDESKGTATLVGWMKILWHDRKLQWNSSEYGGIESIRVSPDEIWKPDLELYNTAAKSPTVNQARILLYSDGTVLWVPPVRFDVFCKLDLKNWPRDSQTCRFLIGSWTHSAMALDLTFDNEGYDGDQLPWDETGSRWKLGDVVMERLVQYYNCCAEPYTSLQYDITVTRRGGAQVFINEAPVIALVALLIAAALREPASRGLILVAVAIISSLYLLTLSVQLPNLTERAPRVAILYCGLLCLSAIWAVTSVLVERLRKLNTKPIPGSLRRFVKKSKLNVAIEEEGTVMSSDNDKPASAAADNWSQLAGPLDAAGLIAGALGLGLLLVLNI